METATESEVAPFSPSTLARMDAAVLTLTVALPNYAALGLPILASVLGENGATSLSVAVSIACGSVLLTPIFTQHAGQNGQAQRGVIWQRHSQCQHSRILR